MTMEAVKQFFEAILQALFGKLPTEKPTDPAKPAPQTISAIPAHGDKGNDVKALQAALNHFGAGLVVDGDFGAKTKNAVSAFQKSKGLAGSGEIGPKTLEHLSLKVVKKDPISGQKTITKDLEGKQARHLHPEMRFEIEKRVFPNGNIPQHWLGRDVVKCALDVGQALLNMNIREVGGNNKGKWVGIIQGVIGVFNPKGTGDAWCKSTMQIIVAFLEDYFQVESPVIASEHCMTTNNAAKKVAGLWSAKCEVGTMFEFQSGTSTSGHTGLVVKIVGEKMETIEGNTGSGSLNDGDGLYYRTRHQTKNGNFTTRGFVRFYPNNKV